MTVHAFNPISLPWCVSCVTVVSAVVSWPPFCNTARKKEINEGKGKRERARNVRKNT